MHLGIGRTEPHHVLEFRFRLRVPPQPLEHDGAIAAELNVRRGRLPGTIEVPKRSSSAPN